MKNSIKLAINTFLILGATSLSATNGDLMIGQGAKSVAMGGVGVATSFGAHSALANPALISSVKHSEISASVTAFMPSVDFKTNDFDSRDSSSDLSFIPEFSYARSYGNFTLGVMASGVAGMGVDYGEVMGTSKDNGSFNMNTELQLFKIAVPIAYKIGHNFAIGVEPVVQLGSLEMNYMRSDGEMSDNPKSSSNGIGFEVGAAYSYLGWTLGGVYKSEIEMTYDDNIGTALNDFGLASVTSGDTLTQPAEYGVGLSYVFHENTLSFDYRFVTWSDASGYGDFGWKDQDVFAIGYQLKVDDLALRVGYNYSESPIVEQNGLTYDGAAINGFNLAGFPGIVEEHFTFGLGYEPSRTWSFDGAFVYSPEVTESFDITAMNDAMGISPKSSTADVAHSQMAFTMGLTYKFY